MMADSSDYPILNPELQVGFYFRLKTIKEKYLHNAMKETVSTLSIKKIDQELNAFVPEKYLTKLALNGLRGELLFAVPCILQQNPFLLGYYRLLLGFSKKEFYTKQFSKFGRLEEKGLITSRTLDFIPNLCKTLIKSACFLLEEIDDFSISTLSELQLLTIGPQFRGSKNNEFGKLATQKTFRLIKKIVQSYIITSTENVILIKNDSGRNVRIEFASDPDIQIIEELKTRERGLISIEIKGGRDISNIHNRIGEAEKSHQKAKSRGYFEFMTILRVNFDYSILKAESPTTSHFFHLDRIAKEDNEEHRKFKEILSSIISISI